MCECDQHQNDTQCSCGECNDDECCCQGGGKFHRHYQTKAEKIADLEAYQSELKMELQAVEEMLADLRK